MPSMDHPAPEEGEVLREHLQSAAAARLVAAGKRREQLRRELADLTAGERDRILFAAKAAMTGRRIASLTKLSHTTVDKIIAEAKANGELATTEQG